MGRKSVTVTVDDCKVTVVQLGPMKVLELLPDVLAAVAPGVVGLRGLQGKLSKGEELTIDDLAALGDPLGLICKALTGGKLAWLVPQILSDTMVIAPLDGGKKGEIEKFELIKGADEIDRCFGGRLRTFAKVIRLATEVTFKDFLSVADLAGQSEKTPDPA